MLGYGIVLTRVAGWGNKAKVPFVHGDEIIKELSKNMLARSDMPHYHHEILWMLLQFELTPRSSASI